MDENLLETLKKIQETDRNIVEAVQEILSADKYRAEEIVEGLGRMAQENVDAMEKFYESLQKDQPLSPE